MPDLTGELASAISAMSDADRAELAAAGIPAGMIDTIGTMRIELDAGGRTYQPLDDIGDKVFILAVRIGDPLTPEHPRPEAIAYCGSLVDLLAWHPSAPEHWALRVDAASWLGAMPPQCMDPRPVSIRRSPLSWLRAGGTGLCILTSNDREAQMLLLGCRGGIVAEDTDHARELRRLLERPFPIPPVFVARSAKRRRAA